MTEASRSTRTFWLVAACFLVSGFAALLYETAWLRQFAILLGTSEQALAIVLSSYMGGLAIGSLIASRYVDRIRRPLLTYGILELGIAISALLVPVGLLIGRFIQASLFGGNPEPPHAGGIGQIAFSLATCFSLILIPTALMGATLPLLARYVVSDDRDLGPRIGMLYAINTAGAVAGTLSAAFLFLPTLGLKHTTWVGALCNAAVFVMILGLVKSASSQANTAAEDGEPVRGSSREKNAPDSENNSGEEKADWKRWILVFTVISGAISFCYEIVFTRMLGHLLGGSIYAFATMLSGFLLGIAIGGAVASRFSKTREQAAKAYVYAQSAIAGTGLIAFATINSLALNATTSQQGFAAITTCIIALLPIAICIGVTFPLAIRVYAADELQAATASAKVYGWNVLGAIVGSLATALILMPAFQYKYTTAIAVMSSLLIAVAGVALLGINKNHFAAPALAFLALLVCFPKHSEGLIRISAIHGGRTPGEIIFHHVGHSATVTVFDDAGSIRFLTNGLPESAIAPRGSGVPHLSSGRWLSALPPLVRPECKSMLIIGLGGGVAAERVPPSIESIDVIELEPAVVQANQIVADIRERDPLQDDRIKIILNDGRNALALTNKRYDCIVSQPSHPWTAGASHLYTVDFDRLAKRHLQPGGVFLQWMDSGFIDEFLLASMAKSLGSVFEHVRMYQPFDNTLLFVASDEPIRPEATSAKTRGQEIACELAPENRAFYRRMGVVSPTHLFSMLVLDEAGVREASQQGELITDERNLLAMRAPRLMKGHDPDRAPQFAAEFSPIARGKQAVLELCPSFDLQSFARSQQARGYKLMKDQYTSALAKNTPVEIELALNDKTKLTKRKTPLARLQEGFKRYPQDQRIAFELLRTASLGRTDQNKLAAGVEEAARAVLSKDQAMVLSLLEPMNRGEFASLREADRVLAGIEVDDPAFVIAVRLRVIWRLESDPTERQKSCTEAIRIMDDASAFGNASGLGWFRTMAAIRADQPQIALGTAKRITRTILDEARTSKTIDGAALSVLMQIRESLRETTAFSGVTRQEYQQTVALVDSVLAMAGQGI